jgi:hypothetical protein
MKPAEYITLEDGRKVRVYLNCNSLGIFNQMTGKDLSAFAMMKADMFTLRTLAYCAASEGEDADGKELEMSEKQFGRLMDVQAIKDFSIILNRRMVSEEQKKSEERVTETQTKETSH